MALTDGDSNGMVMPVSPMYGGGNGGFGGFGNGDWAWIILLLLLGWGGNGWGGNGFGGGELYPWMNQAELTQGGFRDQMINGNITGIRDSLSDISTQICNGFAGVEAGASARAMAEMNRSFALQSQFADCCCENRLGLANLGADIAREACATRTNDTQNTQAILNVVNGGIQSIKDQLCADKIDAKNDEISQLRQELLYARGQASQDVQTATLRASQATTANELLTEMRACPIPAMPVYGQTPIFTCGGGNCGCGCGA
jgi:hypothetical protein